MHSSQISQTTSFATPRLSSIKQEPLVIPDLTLSDWSVVGPTGRFSAPGDGSLAVQDPSWNRYR